MKKKWQSHFQVGVIAVAAITLAGYAFFYPSSDELLGRNPQKNGKKVAAIKADELEKIKKSITAPEDWTTSSKHRLFLSSEYLYFPERNVVELKTPDIKVGPFPLGWLQKYDLPILDLTVATQDPDEDGFTNIMEYNEADPASGTNPIDPQSHSAYITRLRVKEVKSSRKEFKLTTAQQLDGEDVFSLIVETDEGRRSLMKKKGEKIEGFDILGFTSKKETRKNAATGSEEVVDVSELEVENKEMEIKTVFVIGQAKDIPDLRVSFVLALVNKVDQPFTVERGKVFDVFGTKYRLLETVSGGVKIKSIDGNKEYQIPTLSADDQRLLPPVAKPAAK